MPAQWTGRIVGEMHNRNITRKMLAVELGWHEKYLIKVLNAENPPSKSEAKIRAALDRLLNKAVPTE